MSVRISLALLFAMLLSLPAYADDADTRESNWVGSPIKGVNEDETDVLAHEMGVVAPWTQEEETYAGDVLKPGMQLFLELRNDPSLSGLLVVNEQGMLELPMAGSVKVAGLKLAAARQQVWRAYADGYFVDPRLSLDLVTGE